MSGLVDQYAVFATGDAVIKSLQKQGLLPVRGGAPSGGREISASAVPSPLNGQPTPLLTITGTATSPAEATKLTIGATKAFINYARSRQNAKQVPENQRVELRIVKGAGAPTLAVPRSKTKFIIILLAGLTATVAAAFVRDNQQRAGTRESQPESVSLDPVVREAEGPLLNGSEPVHGAAWDGVGPESTESGAGQEIPSLTRARRSAGSSG